MIEIQITNTTIHIRVGRVHFKAELYRERPQKRPIEYDLHQDTRANHDAVCDHCGGTGTIGEAQMMDGETVGYECVHCNGTGWAFAGP